MEVALKVANDFESSAYQSGLCSNDSIGYHRRSIGQALSAAYVATILFEHAWSDNEKKHDARKFFYWFAKDTKSKVSNVGEGFKADVNLYIKEYFNQRITTSIAVKNAQKNSDITIDCVLL